VRGRPSCARGDTAPATFSAFAIAAIGAHPKDLAEDASLVLDDRALDVRPFPGGAGDVHVAIAKAPAAGHVPLTMLPLHRVDLPLPMLVALDFRTEVHRREHELVDGESSATSRSSRYAKMRTPACASCLTA